MSEDEREYLDVLLEAANYLAAQGKAEYAIAVRSITIRMEDGPSMEPEVAHVIDSGDGLHAGVLEWVADSTPIGTKLYTAEQVRAAVLAERERCARIADTKAEGIERVNTYRGKVNAVSQHAADMVADVASAIRSGTAPAQEET
jgi:hypothetical protein